MTFGLENRPLKDVEKVTSTIFLRPAPLSKTNLKNTTVH